MNLTDKKVDDDEIIGNEGGVPYTLGQLRKDILESEQDILNGDFIEHKDLKRS